MPLSPPTAKRRHLHTRAIEFRGYERDDGMWEIEGHLTDTKTYGFPNRDRGRIEAGEPVHDMWLRLVIDETLTIRDAEAAMDGTPYTYCGTIAPAFQALRGMRIEPGWTRAVHRRLGGVRGCTHLVELLRPLASAALQTILPARAKRSGATAGASDRPPRQLNKCHALAEDGPVVRERMPKFYTGSDGSLGDSFEGPAEK